MKKTASIILFLTLVCYAASISASATSYGTFNSLFYMNETMKQAEAQNTKPAEQPAINPTGKPTLKPVEQPAEKPSVNPSVSPTEEPNEKTETVQDETAEENENTAEELPQYISLMYHKISEDEAEQGAFCISPEQFEADIRYLKEAGYTFCTTEDIALIEEKRSEKCVFITFDDGYESDFVYALPILRKYDAKATFFVIGSQIGKDDHITEKSLKKLAASKAAEIGNHTYAIHNKSLDEIRAMYENKEYAGIKDDFKKNKELLEKLTGTEVISASYPNGIWSQEADAAIRELGIKATFTSDEMLIKELSIPFGRYNRDNERTPEILIQKAYTPAQEAEEEATQTQPLEESVPTEEKQPENVPMQEEKTLSIRNRLLKTL